jgi:hypothetical protein
VPHHEEERPVGPASLPAPATRRGRAPLRPVGPPIPEYSDEAAPAGAAARGRGTLRHDPAEGGYVFALGEVQYRLPTDGPAMQSGLLCVDGRVGEGPWVPLLREAGMLYRDGDGRVYTPPRAADRLRMEPLRPTARGKTLSLRYVERADAEPSAGADLSARPPGPPPSAGSGPSASRQSRRSCVHRWRKA